MNMTRENIIGKQHTERYYRKESLGHEKTGRAGGGERLQSFM